MAQILQMRIPNVNYLSVTVFVNFVCACMHILAFGGRGVMLKQVKVSSVV